MKVYKLNPDVDYYNIFELKNESDKKLIDTTGSLISNWSPLEIKFFKKKKVGDIAWLYPNDIIINEKAKTSITPLVKNDVELLPLKLLDDTYYFFNVITILDALDEEHSDISRLDNGKIINCRKYNFKEEVLNGVHVFMLPQFLKSKRIYVSEEFKKVTEENGLKGYQFIEL